MLQKRHRYPGSRPFEGSEGALFFGREDDIEDLYRIMNIDDLVVLYGKSGLGKSSLLNAGLIPKLLQESSERDIPFQPVSVRFGSYIKGSKTPVEKLLAAAFEGTELKSGFLDKFAPSKSSFWYHFKSQQLEQLKNGTQKQTVLILDQFEELFTYPQEQVDDFKRNLEEVITSKVPKRYRKILKEAVLEDENAIDDEIISSLYESLNIKILIAIRSDKLSLLNKLKDVIPSILHRCVELTPMDRVDAEEAIVNPAHFATDDSDFASTTFDYSEEALEKMLNFLTNNGSKGIESFQLQILCQYVENIVIEKNKDVITENELENINNIYENYYDHQISRLNKAEQELARTFIEEGLLYTSATEQRRISLYEGQCTTVYKVSKDLLDKLVSTHIIRAAEGSTGGLMYEVSHDTLVAPIIKSRDKRLSKVKAAEDKAKAIKEEKEAAEKRRKKVLRKGQFIGVTLLTGLVIVMTVSYIQLRSKDSKLLEQLSQISDLEGTDNAKELVKLQKELEQEKAKIISLEATLDSTIHMSQLAQDSIRNYYIHQALDNGDNADIAEAFNKQIEELEKINNTLREQYSTAKRKMTQVKNDLSDIYKQWESYNTKIYNRIVAKAGEHNSVYIRLYEADQNKNGLGKLRESLNKKIKKTKDQAKLD